MKLFAVSVLGALLCCFAACETQNNDYYEYSFIDTVLAGDTIRNDDPAPVVHVYPRGCNHFDRFESTESADTLDLAVLYHFDYEGRPCVHGSGLDTTNCVLSFSAGGARYMRYQRDDSTWIVQPVFVED
ncbi:MAG: hypothetical protein MUF59_08925 [Candidatus Krumholzibacteria bacterium]|jgi:hypothetical protein|nr:hypothetical protein [Candidatus Krumholzibacteria bacterium]